MSTTSNVTPGYVSGASTTPRNESLDDDLKIMNYCIECGSKVDINANFCNFCGTDLRL